MPKLHYKHTHHRRRCANFLQLCSDEFAASLSLPQILEETSRGLEQEFSVAARDCIIAFQRWGRILLQMAASPDLVLGNMQVQDLTRIIQMLEVCCPAFSLCRL